MSSCNEATKTWICSGKLVNLAQSCQYFLGKKVLSQSSVFSVLINIDDKISNQSIFKQLGTVVDGSYNNIKLT